MCENVWDQILYHFDWIGSRRILACSVFTYEMSVSGSNLNFDISNKTKFKIISSATSSQQISGKNSKSK